MEQKTELLFRTVQRQMANGNFEEIQFSELKYGDQFRLLDPNGSPEDGETVYVATGDAYSHTEAVLVTGETHEVPGNFAIEVA